MLYVVSWLLLLEILDNVRIVIFVSQTMTSKALKLTLVFLSSHQKLQCLKNEKSF